MNYYDLVDIVIKMNYYDWATIPDSASEREQAAALKRCWDKVGARIKDTLSKVTGTSTDWPMEEEGGLPAGHSKPNPKANNQHTAVCAEYEGLTKKVFPLLLRVIAPACSSSRWNGRVRFFADGALNGQGPARVRGAVSAGVPQAREGLLPRPPAGRFVRVRFPSALRRGGRASVVLLSHCRGLQRRKGRRKRERC